MTATVTGRNQESQENYTSTRKQVPAGMAAPTKGEIEQDNVPVGVNHAGRIQEKNCVRKSRKMQEVLGMMAGAWEP